jgi:hypothetical protein
VRKQLKVWPEKGKRAAMWLPARDAVRLVHKRQLHGA